MKSVFTDTESEAKIQRINGEIVQQTQEIDQRQNEKILQRDQQRRREFFRDLAELRGIVC